MEVDRKLAETRKWPQANSYSFVEAFHYLAFFVATSQS